MSWAVGYDENWKRDVGYGVPAICDYPGCNSKIDRGICYLCGGPEANYGQPYGCGLFFCSMHKRLWSVDPDNEEADWYYLCDRCAHGEPPFEPTPDRPEWIRHKLTDPTWERWRAENPDEVAELSARRKDSP